MKPYRKLLIAFAAIVLCACVLAPLAKPLVDRAVPANRKLADKLHYNEATRTYRFGKVFRRLLMGSAILVLLVGARRLEIGSVATLGFRGRSRWRRDLVSGIAIGLVSMAAFMVALVLLGAAVPKGAVEPGKLLGDMAKFLLQVVCIGLFEEALFRGVVLQTLMKDMRFLAAAVLSSVLYSLLHFFQAHVPVGMGSDVLIGFRSLAVCFAPVVSDPSIIPAFLGLFLLGMVFAYSYRWTGALYLPIALHASWVFALKTAGKLLFLGLGKPEWLCGTKQIVDGVLGCVFLLAVSLLLWFLYGRGGASSAGEAR